MTVTRKPDHRGEHEVSRNHSRAGMPGLTGELVVTTLVCFLLCTRGCGCIGARHSPRPLISGRNIHAYLGRLAPRECESVSLCLAVIARSPCDEAIHLLSRAASWIASL